MSNKLQDKILKAGVIPANAVGQMEQWKTMPEGSVEKVGQFDPERVKQLAEDIEVEHLPELRETILDIDKIMNRTREIGLGLEGVLLIAAGIDILGRYFIAIPDEPAQQNQIIGMLKDGSKLVDNGFGAPRNLRTITNAQTIWSKIDRFNNVATHWMVETVSPGEEHIVRGR